MANMNSTFTSSYGLESTPTSDMRKRFYTVNPIIDCATGIERGHVEILLFRRWLVILSKARR